MDYECLLGIFFTLHALMQGLRLSILHKMDFMNFQLSGFPSPFEMLVSQLRDSLTVKCFRVAPSSHVVGMQISF